MAAFQIKSEICTFNLKRLLMRTNIYIFFEIRDLFQVASFINMSMDVQESIWLSAKTLTNILKLSFLLKEREKARNNHGSLELTSEARMNIWMGASLSWERDQ